jgi:hypothetical protein
MDFEDDDENQPMEEDYDEEGGDQMEADIDDVPVTQEDAWAVIR